ncbi:hypothetical protein [Barrientosiimonas endolithica]|uniref:Uncharacterized protein n=1 Tax=Barrientosiimonas endolithica TaxID=1535208 RepID=A0ABM8H7R5_9MICO|nr:hypothetical protein [Barrientosiimonas endolithica]BDZ56915.1 hypothetical protein GCM10025872_05720 [Barrientosiimonas endolithica]
MHLALDVDRGAAPVRGGVGGAHAEPQRLAHPHRAVLHDPVAQVHRPGERVGVGAVGEQRDLQREGQHVQVGRGQLVAQREAADPVVGRERGRIDLDVGAHDLQVGQRPAAAGGRSDRLGEQTGQPRLTGELDGAGHGQAPSWLWPQTRST